MKGENKFSQLLPSLPMLTVIQALSPFSFKSANQNVASPRQPGKPRTTGSRRRKKAGGIRTFIGGCLVVVSNTFDRHRWLLLPLRSSTWCLLESPRLLDFSSLVKIYKSKKWRIRNYGDNLLGEEPSSVLAARQRCGCWRCG